MTIRYQEIPPLSFTWGWFQVYQPDAPLPRPEIDARFVEELSFREDDGRPVPFTLMSWCPCPHGAVFRVRLRHEA